MNVARFERIERFFWPPVENDDYLKAASHRALVLFSLAGFLISCWMVYRYLFVQSQSAPLITELVLYSFPVFLLFPFLLIRNASIKTVGRAFSIYTVLRLTVLAVFFGGISSTQSLFLIPVVLIATFVLGGKEGFVGLAATICVYLALFYGQKNQLTSTAELAELRQHLAQLLAVLVMVVCAGATFRHQLVKAVEDLAEAKAEADASNLAKSQFLANMSHEIRTPMNGVLGMADTLKFTELSPKQEMLVQTIDRSGNALLTIINDILDFSKIEAGKLVLNSDAVDLRELIDDVGSLLRTSATAKNIDLIVECNPNVPGLVGGDSGRIRQVLINLVGNAIKFTHEGTVRIDVSSEIKNDDANIRIEVSDTGIGITDEKLGKVFDKFSQVDGSTTRRYGGTGLGLAISKSLIDAMGGAISVESSIGMGSTFFFDLKMPIIEKAAKPHTPSLQNETKVPVLVIAGNDTNRTRIVKNLTSWGAQTVRANSGQKAVKALAKIAETRFDFPLIVLDSELPDINSLQILDHIKSFSPDRQTPIIFVQSQHHSDAVHLHMKARADFVLGPSFSKEDLKQAVYELLRKPSNPKISENVEGPLPSSHGIMERKTA